MTQCPICVVAKLNIAVESNEPESVSTVTLAETSPEPTLLSTLDIIMKDANEVNRQYFQQTVVLCLLKALYYTPVLHVLYKVLLA